MVQAMRKPQLDGLRFVLFLLVFATHYARDPLRVGYLGYALPVFFVMSGFLITNVLVSAEHLDLATKLKVFYARRVLRICPSYFLVVGVLIAMDALTFPGYFLTYLVNFKLFAISLDPQSSIFQDWIGGNWRKESWHLWSLSVEEQFYILYPLVLYLTPAKYRVPMLFSVVLGSIVSRFLFKAYFPQAFYGAQLPVCAEYFAWGCLFSWWEARKKLATLSPVWTFNLSLLAIFALIAVEFFRADSGYLQFRTTHYQTPIAVAMGFFVWGLWSLKPTHIAARFLSCKPLVYFGEMSYTLYLVHLLAQYVFVATKIDLPFSPHVDQIFGSFILTMAMAMAIWHLFEKPVYSFRRYLPYGRPAKRLA